MATDEEVDKEKAAAEVVGPTAGAPLDPVPGPGVEDQTPAELGTAKYVHAAFFAGGILIAYLSMKILAAISNASVDAIPQLQRYSTGERETFAMIAGVVIGILAIVQTYRKEGVRTWANDVAVELTKVTWPNREAVTNGTIVVIVASIVATLYIGVLDRFWGFVTTLVYGA